MATLKSNLTKIAQQSPLRASRALRQTAQDIFAISQQLVPVDIGELKESGEVEVVSEKVVIVGYKAPHAPFQEFGTVNMEAQPYLVPSFAQAEDIMKVRMKEEMEKIT